MVKRADDDTDGGKGNAPVDDGGGHISRLLPARCLNKAGQSHLTLDQVVVGGLVGIGAVLPKAEQPRVNQPGVFCSQLFITQPEPGHRARPQVVDEGIGGFDEAKHDFARFLAFEIQRE